MLKPGELYWSVIEPYWLPLNKTWDGGSNQFRSMFAKVPSAVGDLYAAHWCQTEVCNGGFHQFFSNTTGLLAPEALIGFRNIGIDSWANLLERAIEFFGSEYPKDRAERCSRLPKSDGRKRADWNSFEGLDRHFFEWLQHEPDRWYRIADSYAERATAVPRNGSV